MLLSGTIWLPTFTTIYLILSHALVSDWLSRFGSWDDVGKSLGFVTSCVSGLIVFDGWGFLLALA